MKKIIALILACLMLATMVACGNTNTDDVDTTEAIDTTEVADTTEASEVSTANVSLEAIANAIMSKYAEFSGMRATYDEYMAELDEADQIPYEEFISYQLNVAPVEENAEWLMALNEVPTGYTEGYCYQPGMMGQAFIGYIFRVAEGTDIEAFKKSLTDNCDPRWNICTMANTTVCENYGDLVYFSMMVVADAENPDGFTAEQKDAFYNTFVATIEASAN